MRPLYSPRDTTPAGICIILPWPEDPVLQSPSESGVTVCATEALNFSAHFCDNPPPVLIAPKRGHVSLCAGGLLLAGRRKTSDEISSIRQEE